MTGAAMPRDAADQSGPPTRGPVVVYRKEDLNQTASRLGAELTEAYPGGMLLVAVLKGSIFFLADLVRSVGCPCEVDFLGISSYVEGTGRVRLTKDLDVDVCDRDVVLVEDIVDTGLTCNYVLGELRRRSPRSVEVCALFDRRASRIVPVPLRFVGHEVRQDLLVGYGLDVAGRYRNLPFVAVTDRRTLEHDPDAHVTALYGR
jgi:hypoxanthine phosphoribosyltransferase